MATSQLTRAAWLAAFASLLSVGAVGFAQDTQAGSDEDDEGLKEIVVTGSRLRRDEFQSTAPLQLVTREETVLAGLSNTTETLQSTGITSGGGQINNAFGGFVTSGGPGANTVGLRGLGPGRSLILLNGRRIAPAGTRGSVGTVDLNVLPSAIIDRVEVLRDGASSVYGSDAVAGVINVITMNKVEGLTLEGNVKSPFDGDGDQYRLSGVIGYNSERLSLKGSIDVYRRTDLRLSDRDWTQCNQDYVFQADGTTRADFIDPRTGQPKCYPITNTGSNGVTINTLGTPAIAGAQLAAGFPAAPAGYSTFCNRWRPNAAATGSLAGYECVGGIYFNPTGNPTQISTNLNVRDTFDPRTLNRSLISPVEIKVAYAEGSYKLEALGNAEIYGMFLANRRESDQTGFRQLSLDYPRFLVANGQTLPCSTAPMAGVSVACTANPFVPANVALGNFLGNAGSAVVNPLSSTAVRSFIGFDNDQSRQTVDYQIGGLGLRGDLFIEGWKYDLYAGISKSDSEYIFESWLTDRMLQSMDVVVAPAGTAPIFVRTVGGVGYTCRINTITPSTGCIPGPPLTAAVIGGQLPQDWIDWTFGDVVGKTIYEESNFTLNLDGGLFEMPAGQVLGSLGLEYRQARINDTPAAASQAGNLYNLTASAITRGTDSVREIYAEVEIPLLRDLPGAKELTFNVSGRYTDYDSYGSDDTYKVSLAYKPVDWVTLRGTFGTSYRAPALFEQFLGATTGFLSQQTDRCNAWDSLPVGSPRRTNCQAEGLPPGFQQTQGITVFSQGGAAQGLLAETSENFTVGLVFRPNFLPEGFGELAFSVDYYDIKIDNGVARVGSGNLQDLCYNDPGFRGPTSAGYCTYVQRAAGTNRLTVLDSYTNVAKQGAEGIDYNLRYTRDIGPGRFRVNLEVQTFRSQELQNIPSAAVIDFNNTIGQPKTTGELDLTYTWGDWRVRGAVEYIGAMDSNALVGNLLPSGAPNPANVFAVPSYSLFHSSVEYRADNWTATFGFRNITDEVPPSISSGVYNRVGNAALYSGYDYVGRTAFMNLAVKF